LVDDLTDPRRTEPAYVADERTMLVAWLEFHRMTLLLKCEGVARAGLVARPVATSLLSLHGLVRHMADVERSWFTRVLLRAPDTKPLFFDPSVEDSELVPWMTPTGSMTWRCGNRSARAAVSTRPASRWMTPGSGVGLRSRCAGSMST
jgi:hypothetical protein